MKKNTDKPVDYKKHCLWFATLSLTALLACAVLVIIVDPFFQYHKPITGLYYLIENKINQNPGIAKNFEYDSAILGSSMTVNFNTDVFAETMDLNTIKLSYDGAYPQDIDNIFGFMEQSSNELDTVFLGIDIFTYKATPGITAYELPQHLYDDTVLSDIPYLLNKDVILQYIFRPQVEREGTPLNEMYYSYPHMQYGTEHVAASYTSPTEFLETLPADYYAENIQTNLETCILPHIEAHPNTKFIVFFPPYSVLYWYNRSADGSLEAEIAGEMQIIETLLAYPNVEVYYFQNQFDYITDLDNYCDYTHYWHEMNDYMTVCFSDGTYKLTEDNYQEVLKDMLEWLKKCPFEEYVP